MRAPKLWKKRVVRDPGTRKVTEPSGDLRVEFDWVGGEIWSGGRWRVRYVPLTEGEMRVRG